MVIIVILLWSKSPRIVEVRMNGDVMGWWQVWPFPASHVPDYEILSYIRATLLTSEFMIVS